MLVYLILFTVILTLIFLSSTTMNEQAITVFYVLIWFFLFILIGFRHYSIGNDTYGYIRLFLNSRLMSLDWTEFFTSRYELGFLTYNKWLYGINQHPSTVLVGFALPTVVINAYVLYKKSVNPCLSLFIFCAYRYFSFSLSGIRPMMALSLLFLSYYFYDEKKYLRAVLTVVLASSFHLSSLVFAIALIFQNIRLTKLKMLTLSGVALFFFLVMDRVFLFLLSSFEKYSYYEEGVFQESAKLGSLLNFLILLLIFLFGEWIGRQEQAFFTKNSLRVLSFYGVLVSFVALRVTVFDRFSAAFALVALLYVPFILSRIQSREWRVLAMTGVCLSFCLYFFLIILLRPEWNYIVPYRSILF